MKHMILLSRALSGTLCPCTKISQKYNPYCVEDDHQIVWYGIEHPLKMTTK